MAIKKIDVTPKVDEIIMEKVEEVKVNKAPTKDKNGEKLVRIRVAKRFKCYIGEWYYFETNKTYNVPENVKNVLMQRGILLPM